MIRTFLLSFVFFWIFGGIAHAASVGFGAPQQTASAGVFMTPLLMATDGFPLNAVEGTITVADDVTDVYDTSSIVAFWTKAPSIKNGTVAFSGIIPGGFEGTGILFWLVHEGDSMQETARIDSFTALRNDGLGTKDALSIETNGRLSAGAAEVVSIEQDQTPPEAFSVAIIAIADGSEATRYAASFATRDNETGIDHYEVQETKARNPAEDGWVVAESPYVLKDQSRKSTVFVRAIDNAGNIREGSSKATGSMQWTLLLVILLVALIIGVWRFLRKRRTT
jgi:hypothetical protein